MASLGGREEKLSMRAQHRHRTDRQMRSRYRRCARSWQTDQAARRQLQVICSPVEWASTAAERRNLRKSRAMQPVPLPAPLSLVIAVTIRVSLGLGLASAKAATSGSAVSASAKTS